MAVPAWTPPASAPVDRRNVSVAYVEHIEPMLSWLAQRYGGNHTRGMIVWVRPQPGADLSVPVLKYFVAATNPDGTHVLQPLTQADADQQALKSAQQAKADARAALDAIRPITESGGYLVMPRLDGTARLLYGPAIVATPSTFELRGKTLSTVILTEAPA